MSDDEVVEAEPVDEPVQSSQERVEDVAFEGLIARYMRLRDQDMLRALNHVYGRVLMDRVLHRG